jgi:NADH-quinone oxidoreductase subunit B
MGIGKKSDIEKNEYPIVATYEGGSIILAQLDALVNWSRSNSLWPLTFGTRCCAMELMAVGASRHDFSRFGFEVARATPRQADMIIIAGSINYKMAPVLKRLYDQIADPKYVIAMGACAVSGGPFFYNSYAIMKGADHVIPVDVYVPGCPPRPEALLYGMMQLQKKIKREKNFKKVKLVDVKPVLNQK